MQRPTGGDVDGKKNDFLIDKRIQEAWATNRFHSISPEWMHITKKGYTTDIFPDFPRPPFLATKQRTLPYLRRNELILPAKEQGYSKLRAKSCHDNTSTKLPLINVEQGGSTQNDVN